MLSAVMQPHTAVQRPFVQDYSDELVPEEHSPTHTHEEEEERFAQTTRSIAWALIPFTMLLASQR